MAEYFIRWEIEVDAEDPMEALMKAKWLQVHGDWSSVFDIREDRHGHAETVDLDDILTEEQWEKIRMGRYEEMEKPLK
jgi:hypothetical protein